MYAKSAYAAGTGFFQMESSAPVVPIVKKATPRPITKYYPIKPISMSIQQICLTPDDHYVHRVQFQPGLVALPCACGNDGCCGYALVINNHWQIQQHAYTKATKEWYNDMKDILHSEALNSTHNYMPRFGGGILAPALRWLLSLAMRG